MASLITKAERDQLSAWVKPKKRLELVDLGMKFREEAEEYRTKQTNAMVAAAIVETELRHRRRNRNKDCRMDSKKGGPDYEN